MLLSKVTFLVLVSVIIGCADGYSILLVFGIPGKSLSILGEAFVRLLIDAGHEVTYVTSLPMKNKPQSNFREIDASKGLEGLFAKDNMTNISYLLDHKEVIRDIEELMQVGVDVTELTLENKNVKQLLNEKDRKFDAVIADQFISELLVGLAAYYECPMIWSYSIGVDWTILDLVHEPSNPAYTTDFLSLNVPPLTFRERIEELWTQVHSTWIKRNIIQKRQAAIYKRVFKPLFKRKRKTLPLFEDLIYNASLVLANLHHAIGGLPGLPQNFKLIGGFHIDVPTKPLPDDLQNLMDNAKNGVIYFSMGSMWESKTMPQSLKDGLLKTFGGLKQTVLWKYEGDISNLPRNVHTLKWAPQQSILAHPNCVIFISHGGQLSSTEALHYGVPTIGVPILFDQFINIQKAVANGYALKVELTHNLPSDLKAAIDIVVNDPKYKVKAKELSEIYHDRPAPPAAELVHWVQHVVKTRGAPHLRSPALMTPWYQKTYLDFVALVLVVLIVILVVLKKILNSFVGKRVVGAGKKKN